MAGKFAAFSEEQKDQLLESLEGLYNDPELGISVQELVEKKFGVTDPSLAATRRHQKETQELREQLASLESKTLEKEIKSRVNSEKDAAQKQYRLSDEDMKEVSKSMLENGISNYDKAAHYYQLSRQAAIPTTDKIVEHTAMTLPGDIELFKNPTGWTRKQAYQTIAEIERNRAA